MALPRASATCSRLPEVYDVRELNEIAVALNFMETGGIGSSESCEKVEYSMLCTGPSSPVVHRLHSVISDLRPPSGTESGEAALQKLLASRAVGGYSLTSDDPAPAPLTVFSHRELLDHMVLRKLLTLCHC